MGDPSFLKLDTPAEYRAHFEALYCHNPIVTFDGISVRFRKTVFNHAFFESSSRDQNKDMFSEERAKRMDWIKLALEDRNAELYQGYDKRKKKYDPQRRVAIVQRNYVVVIKLSKEAKADFITAYVANEDAAPGHNFSTLEKIKMSPKWT